MRMIPSQPLNTTSRAELRVFDQLRAAFSRPDQNGWFALHSLSLPSHMYKRFGEIDFVVCGPDGIFVIEVKGGRVACQDGVWETINRYGEVNRLRESPFKQAETALHGLKGKLPVGIRDRFTEGYGVVMPDIERLPDSAEWDRVVLADGRDFKEFEKWLVRLVSHWSARNSRRSVATPGQLNELRQHFRPDFEAVMPLHAAVNDVQTRIVRLTADQLKWIDVVEANPRVLCSGGAGTGKTMLALELARRWCASGMKTVLACQSRWLKSFLDRRVIPGLTVSLVDSLHVSARRAGIDRFDALIVDEGQDVLNMNSLDQMDRMLTRGLEGGRWCFFHDVNNQSGLCGSYLPDAYLYLESLNPVQIPLTTNCRNSLQILQRIQGSLGADLGAAGVGNGPAVRETQVDDDNSAILALEQELHDLIELEGFNAGDIVVLSPVPLASSWVASLRSKFRSSIVALDDASPRSDGRNKIGFAQIGDFKGLESEVVVLVDMPLPGHCETFHTFHYVGMSRARALLSMICC